LNEPDQLAELNTKDKQLVWTMKRIPGKDMKFRIKQQENLSKKKRRKKDEHFYFFNTWYQTQPQDLISIIGSDAIVWLIR
jgi:hypothetical protein